MYRAQDAAAITALRQALATSGWYDLVDQANLGGVASRPLGVLPANAALEPPWSAPEPISAEIPAPKRRIRVGDLGMTYYEQGRGTPIVFLHGDAMSSYLWRQVVPYAATEGRAIALDLIGAGDSDKLPGAGPDSYRFTEHAHHLANALDALDLEDEIVLVGHDWGANLAFDWAMKHPDRVTGLAFTEAVLPPFEWTDWPAALHGIFEIMRSEEGERRTLEENFFVLGTTENMTRILTDRELREIVRPYGAPGEGRRPTVAWPREVPLGEEQTSAHAEIARHTHWLRASPVPKLHLQGIPGCLDFGRRQQTIDSFPNLTRRPVLGWHFTPEEDPHGVGRALVNWLRTL